MQQTHCKLRNSTESEGMPLVYDLTGLDDAVTLVTRTKNNGAWASDRNTLRPEHTYSGRNQEGVTSRIEELETRVGELEARERETEKRMILFQRSLEHMLHHQEKLQNHLDSEGFLRAFEEPDWLWEAQFLRKQAEDDEDSAMALYAEAKTKARTTVQRRPEVHGGALGSFFVMLTR